MKSGRSSREKRIPLEVTKESNPVIPIKEPIKENPEPELKLSGLEILTNTVQEVVQRLVAIERRITEESTQKLPVTPSIGGDKRSEYLAPLTSEASDGHSDFGRDPISYAPKNRRASFYQKHMQFSPPEPIKGSQILYQPVQSTLMLERLNVGSVMKFMEDYKRLQQKQRTIPLKLGDFLSIGVINQLVSEAQTEDDKDYSDKVSGDTLQLDSDIIYELILRVIRPRTKEILLKALNRNLKFPELPSGYVVSASYYKPMYEALLIWRTKFNNLFDILTSDAEFTLPPLRTINQVKGLIAAFVDPIPFDHGNKILRSLNQEQIKKMKSIQTDFIPVFFEVVRQTYSHSQRIYDINLSLDMKEDRKYTAKADRNPKSLKKIQGEEYSVDESQDGDGYSDEEAAHEDQSEHMPLLSALTLPQGKSAVMKEMPCYSMLRTGKCVKGQKCTFSHDSTVLRKGWETAMEELKQSPYNPRKLPSAAPERPTGKLVELAKVNTSENEEEFSPSATNDHA